MADTCREHVATSPGALGATICSRRQQGASPKPEYTAVPSGALDFSTGHLSMPWPTPRACLCFSPQGPFCAPLSHCLLQVSLPDGDLSSPGRWVLFLVGSSSLCFVPVTGTQLRFVDLCVLSTCRSTSLQPVRAPPPLHGPIPCPPSMLRGDP